MKKPGPRDNICPGILTWAKFVGKYGTYLECEPQWRRELIEGNADYYSDGLLPKFLPVLSGKLWDIVVSETTAGKRVDQAGATKEKA